MAGIDLTLTLDDEETRRMLEGMADRLHNMLPLYEEIGEILHESVQTNFEEHRAPDGTPWASLNPGYAAWKASRGRNADHLLILNRILMGSLHPEPHADRLEYGTNVVYAAIHQFGGKAGRGLKADIPARPYLPASSDEISEWDEILDAVRHHVLGGTT